MIDYLSLLKDLTMTIKLPPRYAVTIRTQFSAKLSPILIQTRRRPKPEKKPCFVGKHDISPLCPCPLTAVWPTVVRPILFLWLFMDELVRQLVCVAI